MAGAVRFHGIQNNSLWTDEFFSLAYSCGQGVPEEMLPRDQLINSPIAPTRLRFAQPISHIPHAMNQDTHPPLYPVVLRIWRDCFGETDFASRALSAVFSMLSVLLLYLTIRVASRRVASSAALWSAALLAVSAAQVEFAHETRSYAMLLAELLACGWLILSIEKKGPGLARCAAFAGCAIIAMLTHYYAAPALLAMACYGMIRLDSQSRRRFIATLLISATTYAIGWGPFLWRQRANFSSNMQWIRDANPDGSVARRLTDAALLPAKYLLPYRPGDNWMILPSIAIYVLPLLVLRRSRELLLWWLILMFSIGVVLATDLARASWMLQLLRYSTAASAAGCAIVILSIHAVADRWKYPANVVGKHLASAGVVLATFCMLGPAYDVIRPDFRAMADYLSREMNHDDALVILQPKSTPWYSDVIYMAAAHYARELPRAAVAFTQPPDASKYQALASARFVWVISGDGRDLAAFLPGARVIASAPFPRFAVVFKTRCEQR